MADAGQGEYDLQAQPVPDYEFDQRIDEDAISLDGERSSLGPSGRPLRLLV
jgi:hypothetical protein